MTYRWVLCYILYHGTEVGVHSCSLQQLNSPFYSSCLAWSIAATITERNRPLPIPYPLAKFDKTPIRAGPLAFGLCGGETSWRILQFTLVFVWNSASLEFYSIKNQATMKYSTNCSKYMSDFVLTILCKSRMIHNQFSAHLFFLMLSLTTKDLRLQL